MTTALVYPHQLFARQPALFYPKPDRVLLVEDPLFVSQYAFHIQKLLLHRLSMDHYAASLAERGLVVERIYHRDLEESASIARYLKRGSTVVAVDPVDDWLEQAIRRACDSAKAKLDLRPTPMFLSDEALIARHFDAANASPSMAAFYRDQRTRRELLLTDKGKPVGGSWSLDPKNRKKLPRGHVPPAVPAPPRESSFEAAHRELRDNHPGAPGSASAFRWPISRDQAQDCLKEFVANRLVRFGDYEDAVDPAYDFIYHSLLSPALNIGLLTPEETIDAAVAAYQQSPDSVPLNSVEGFVRQIVGWREFMAGTYRSLGRRMRTANGFGHSRPMPPALYEATTGIPPIDATVRKVLRLGYAHHIERLMILGNFMLLTEIDPDAIYRWFMELFIDAYDWVMVPNVYAMSQYADGGLITTKPYVSSSNYLRKMTRFDSGDWCDIWDGLYWRFIAKHRTQFEANPRLAMMTAHLDRMGHSKLAAHKRRAAEFLADLHGAASAEF